MRRLWDGTCVSVSARHAQYDNRETGERVPNNGRTAV